MGFSTGTGAGSGSSLASSTDVAFNNPAANNVLTYDKTIAKWKNLPPGDAFKTLFVDDFFQPGDTTDDLTWQRAINSAISANVPVRIFGGKQDYYFTTPVSILNLKNAIIEGTGMHGTTFHAADNKALESLFYSPTGQQGTISNLTFRNFQIHGGMVDEPPGFARGDPNNIVVGDTNIANRHFGTSYINIPIKLNGNLTGGSYALNATIENITIEHVKVYGCNKLPILIERSTNIEVRQCFFKRSLDAGFTFCVGLKFIDNDSEWSGDNGFSLSRGCTDVICTNNRISGCWNAGIFAGGFGSDAGPSRVTIANNTLSNIGERGISLQGGSTSVVISGNNITTVHRGVYSRQNDDIGVGIYVSGMDPVTPGVYTTLASNIVISNNIIDTPEGYGIRIAGTTKAVIDGNYVRNAGSLKTVNDVTIVPTNNGRNIGIGAAGSFRIPDASGTVTGTVRVATNNTNVIPVNSTAGFDSQSPTTFFILDSNGVAVSKARTVVDVDASAKTVTFDGDISDRIGQTAVNQTIVSAAQNVSQASTCSYITVQNNIIIDDRGGLAALNNGLLGSTDSSTWTDFNNTVTGARITAFNPVLSNIVDPGSLIIAKLDMGQSPVRFGFSGDSTGDDIQTSGTHFEWFYRGLQTIIDSYLDAECSYYTSYYDNNVYKKYRIVPIGYMYDKFDKSGELNGQTPTSGPSWVSAAGAWTESGGFAVPSASNSVASLTASTDHGGNGRRVSGRIILNTQTPSTERSFTASIGTDASNRVSVKIAANTSGSITVVVTKVIGGSSSTPISFTSTSITNNVTDSQIPFSLEIKQTTSSTSGTYQLAVYVDAQSQGVSLSSSDFAALGGLKVLQMSAALSSGGVKVERIGLGNINPTPNVVEVWNGSQFGTVVGDLLPDLDVLFPTQLDCMFISTGHNYYKTYTDPATYMSLVETYISRVRAIHTNAGIVISSQNPEFSSSYTNSSNHAKRLPYMRSLAQSRGYGYIPAAEAFNARPDGGLSYLTSDGVHPNANGSQLWGDAFSKWFLSQSDRP